MRLCQSMRLKFVSLNRILCANIQTSPYILVSALRKMRGETSETKSNRPTFPWENFIKKSNGVRSSEYLDPNEMKDLLGIQIVKVSYRATACPLRISSDPEIPRSDTIFRGKQFPTPLIQEEQGVSY